MSPEADNSGVATPEERLSQQAGLGLPSGANMAVCTLTCAAFACFVGFVVVYAHWGTPLVQRMDHTIGEVLLDQGVRFEEAGEYENAVQCYKQALECRFDGPGDRTYALKRIGALLCWREGPEQGLTYLQEACRRPDCPITVYEPLCNSLIELGRPEEALEAAAQWLRDAKEMNHRGHQANATYYEGMAYRALGDNDRAIELFLEGNDILPGGRNAYELGVFHYKAGDHAKALEFLDLFLKGGAGGRAGYARTLRERILKERESTGAETGDR